MAAVKWHSAEGQLTLLVKCGTLNTNEARRSLNKQPKGTRKTSPSLLFCERSCMASSLHLFFVWAEKLGEGTTVIRTWEDAAIIFWYYGMPFAIQTSDLVEISGAEQTRCSLIEACKTEAFDSWDAPEHLSAQKKASKLLKIWCYWESFNSWVSAGGYYKVAVLSTGLEFIALMVH